jgi:hypothetical protein
MNEKDYIKFLKRLQFIEKGDTVYTINNYHIDFFPYHHFKWNVESFRKFVTFSTNNMLDNKYSTLYFKSRFEKYLLESLKR